MQTLWTPAIVGALGGLLVGFDTAVRPRLYLGRHGCFFSYSR